MIDNYMHILRNKRLTIISFYHLPKNFTILRWETNNVIMMRQRETSIKPWFGKRAHTKKKRICTLTTCWFEFNNSIFCEVINIR